MLLWVFMLSLCAAAVALFSDNLPPALRARVLAVQGMIAVGFLLFILLTSNPFLRTFPPRAERQWAEPGAAGPRPGVPSAVPLPRLCRLFGRVRLRRGRPDRGPGRCRLGALGAALDAGIVVRADRRHRDGLAGGRTTPWAGAAGGSGTRSRTPRFMPWLAGTALIHSVHRGGEAGHAEILDHPAGDHHLLAVAGRHLPGALRRADVGARLRHRSRARHVHPAAAGRWRSAAR